MIGQMRRQQVSPMGGDLEGAIFFEIPVNL